MGGLLATGGGLGGPQVSSASHQHVKVIRQPLCLWVKAWTPARGDV